MQALEIIQTLTAEKQAARKEPFLPLKREILIRYRGSRDQMEAELEDLKRIFLIFEHDTVNDKSYSLSEL